MCYNFRLPMWLNDWETAWLETSSRVDIVNIYVPSAEISFKKLHDECVFLSLCIIKCTIVLYLYHSWKGYNLCIGVYQVEWLCLCLPYLNLSFLLVNFRDSTKLNTACDKFVIWFTSDRLRTIEDRLKKT